VERQDDEEVTCAIVLVTSLLEKTKTWVVRCQSFTGGVRSALLFTSVTKTCVDVAVSLFDVLVVSLVGFVASFVSCVAVTTKVLLIVKARPLQRFSISTHLFSDNPISIGLKNRLDGEILLALSSPPKKPTDGQKWSLSFLIVSKLIFP
jgi:hypothetical protein